VDMPALTMVIDLASRTPVVTLDGDLDHATAPELREVLVRLGHAGFDEAVIDLSQIRFMDSGGLHAFAAGRSSGCELSFRNPSSIARRLLEIDAKLRTRAPLRRVDLTPAG
jgi:anti-anti-sigma factor